MLAWSQHSTDCNPQKRRYYPSGGVMLGQQTRHSSNCGSMLDNFEMACHGFREEAFHVFWLNLGHCLRHWTSIGQTSSRRLICSNNKLWTNDVPTSYQTLEHRLSILSVLDNFLRGTIRSCALALTSFSVVIVHIPWLTGGLSPLFIPQRGLWI